MHGVLYAKLGYSEIGRPPCQKCWHGDLFSAYPDREPYYYGVM